MSNMTLTKKIPLKQVVCQFRFQLKEKDSWSTDKPGKLFSALTKDYPNFEPKQAFSFRVTENGPEALPSRTIYNYTDNQKCDSVSVEYLGGVNASYVFTSNINENNLYDWNSFCKKINNVWLMIEGQLDVKLILSIGLRFVNHIPLESNESASSILNEDSGFFSRNIFKKCLGFSSKNDISFNSTEKLITTLATVKIKEKDGDFLLLDMDFISSKVMPSIQKDYLDILNSAHSKIEEVFFSSVKKDALVKMGIPCKTVK